MNMKHLLQVGYYATLRDGNEYFITHDGLISIRKDSILWCKDEFNDDLTTVSGRSDHDIMKIETRDRAIIYTRPITKEIDMNELFKLPRPAFVLVNGIKYAMCGDCGCDGCKYKDSEECESAKAPHMYDLLKAKKIEVEE